MKPPRLILNHKAVLFCWAVLMLLAGCSKAGTDPYACSSQIPAGNSKPSILVIGDSISYGYLPHVKTALPNYDVQHNPCNAFNSRITRTRVNAWLDSRPRWEAITFNNGLWDIAAWSYVDGEAYRQNIKAIATEIKAHTDHPIFVLTTQVPVGAEGRDSTAVQPRNDIARQVMASLGIPVVDLYTVSLTITNLQLDPTNVHYVDAGYQTLANEVLNQLNINYGVN